MAWKRRWKRADVRILVAVAAGAVLALAALAIWEQGFECVRWSTRINVDDMGNVSRTRVCAEFRSRQRGDDPPPARER